MSARHPVFDLSDRLADAFAAASPLSATEAGIPGHDHELDDRSPAGIAALADLLRRFRRELEALPAATDRDSRLAVAVNGAFIDEHLARIERGVPGRDVRHMASVLIDARDTIDAQDRADADGWRAVAARLGGMETFARGWRDSVAQGLEAGDVVAKRQVESVILQLRASVEPEGTYSLIVDGYDGEDETIAAALRDGLAATRRANLETAEWLESTYLPAAPATDGVGRDAYLVEARDHLGADLDPDETYTWGWERVRELLDRMRAVASEIDPDRDLAGVIDLLRTDPRFTLPTADDFIAAMTERQHGAIAHLDGRHFDLPAEVHDVEVRIAAPGGPLGAWYIGPSEDFSRPGSIWWSLGDRQPIPIWDEVSTAYHEGFPGHHMQVGLAVTMRDRLSRVNRALYWKPGSGEGWALYAERLMDELGLLDEPAFVLGYLAASMLRAARVVIDIGCHLDLDIPEDAPFHPGEAWRFELAVELLTDLAFLDPDYAESEVTRYLGWPGQAITYKVGEHAIVDLREEQRERLGDAFSLERFHADVLAAGAVGLDLLRAVVRGELDD